MRWRIIVTAALFAVVIGRTGVVGQRTAVAGTQSGGTKDLSAIGPEEVVRLQRLIKPKPGEARWMEVPWRTDLVGAWEEAAAQGKPLLVWHISGHPLGTC